MFDSLVSFGNNLSPMDETVSEWIGGGKREK